eukprot:1318216-Rhodomonas_salina.1
MVLSSGMALGNRGAAPIQRNPPSPPPFRYDPLSAYTLPTPSPVLPYTVSAYVFCYGMSSASIR